MRFNIVVRFGLLLNLQKGPQKLRQFLLVSELRICHDPRRLLQITALPSAGRILDCNRCVPLLSWPVRGRTQPPPDPVLRSYSGTAGRLLRQHRSHCPPWWTNHPAQQSINHNVVLQSSLQNNLRLINLCLTQVVWFPLNLMNQRFLQISSHTTPIILTRRLKRNTQMLIRFQIKGITPVSNLMTAGLRSSTSYIYV